MSYERGLRRPQSAFSPVYSLSAFVRFQDPAWGRAVKGERSSLGGRHRLVPEGRVATERSPQ